MYEEHAAEAMCVVSNIKGVSTHNDENVYLIFVYRIMCRFVQAGANFNP